MSEKDKAAVALGRKRWKGKTDEEKSEHAQMMNAERWGQSTPEARSAAASAAAKARWAKKKAAVGKTGTKKKTAAKKAK
jgi:hypothetical protein